jgi:hypothetical protein
LFAILVVTTAMLAGCKTPPRQRIPLSPEKIDQISDRARPPEDLSITLEWAKDGQASLGNIRNVPLGVRGSIPLATASGVLAETAVAEVAFGSATVLAALDTGSPYTLTTFDTAQALKLTPLNYVPEVEDEPADAELLKQVSPSPFGPQHRFVSVARLLAMGDMKIYNTPVGILDDERGFAPLWWLNGQRVDAVIGHDVLGSFDSLSVNLEKRLIRVSSGRYHPRPDRLVAALPLVARTPAPIVEAHIDDQGPCRLALVTGGHFGLWLPPKLAAQLGVRESTVTAPPRRRAPDTPVPAGDHRVNISAFELPAVPTLVGPASASGDDMTYGLLGTRVLRDYAVTIDYKAGKVYFEK